jgi:PAS domain S-box-containing protein
MEPTDQFYRDVFEYYSQGILLNRNDSLLLVNQVLCDMVGYPREELLALPLSEVFQRIHPEPIAETDETPKAKEYRILHSSGRLGWCSVKKQSVTYQGQPATLRMYTDITEYKQDQEALEHRRKFLEDILLALPFGVCLNDATGYYRILNKAYCAIYDYQRDEMLGAHYSVIMPPDQVGLANAHFAQLLRGDLGIPVERKRQRKDGSIIYIEAANALVTDLNGQKMVITTARDISDRKLAQAEIERLGQNLTRRVKALDCLYAMSKVIEETPLTLAEALTKTVHLIPPAFQRPENTGVLITLKDSIFATDRYAETPWGLEMPITAFGEAVGRIQVCLLEAGPAGNDEAFLPEERTLMRVIVERLGRIIERSQNDAALRRLNTELKGRNEDLDAFAHTVAHDLKNPLSVMIGFADLLKTEYSTLSQEQVDQYLSLIWSYAGKMTRIIDALLMLSSVQMRQEVPVERLYMAQIIAEVRLRLKNLIEERQGTIVLPAAWPVAMGYSPWVEEVWANYISNALKYAGVPPLVTLGADGPAKGQVRFWVRDNGQGLSLSDQARLFQPLERLTSKRAEGHGFGLSIVRRIVEKLGGQVGVESHTGQGATFYFTLPTEN